MAAEPVIITGDFETKSEADLVKVGAWQYSLDPSTEVICLCYKIGDGKIKDWWPGQPPPYDLFEALEDGAVFEAHNVSFEKAIWINVCMKRYRFSAVGPKQWRDLQAVAAYYAMPPSLEKLSRACERGGKDPEGARLITKYCKLHLKTAKRVIPPEDFQRFLAYCRKDVEEEYEISLLLGDLPEEELLVFQLDQEINERGIPLDVNSIEDAIAIVEKRAEELAEEFLKLTGLKPTQNDKVKNWFHKEGCAVENLQGKYIDKLLEASDEDSDDDGLDTEQLDKALRKPKIVLTPKTRRALELRRRYNKASTKKLAAMLRQRTPEGRAYFQSKYHGAGTGRWTGTGFQPLNMSKGYEDVLPEELVANMRHRDPKWLDIMYGDAMDAVGKASRHHIRARPGHRIIAGDFVSIEAVLLACLAGEEWKIEAFRRKDPIYELMGCKIHKLPDSAVMLAKSDKKAFKKQYPGERFDGKTGELAFGYQGALGAWRKFDDSPRHTDERIVEICKSWRGEHPATTGFWKGLERAAIRAVAHPGEVCECRNVAFEKIDAWLACWLPNGKRIWYFDPQLRLGMPAWHKPEEYEECAAGECDCEPVQKLSYMAQKEGQWKRVYTYGGKLAENVTQAASREILIPAMLRLREYGYPIILSVYDEVVCEVPNGFGSAKEMEEIMAESPGDWGGFLPKGSNYWRDWAKGWPVRADAWEGSVYKK